MVNRKQMIIDVREPFEFADSHVEGAQNIPSGEILSGSAMDDIRKSADTADIVLYCRTGIRAGNCTTYLKQQGISNVANGINEQSVNQMLRDSS